ncbi:autism susceptibility gene 2 protein homolog [Hoplias malabaricus]|uniref:autism susceptibility gene 2 protein homolog n=1 Tax=Hoplias malabaricus TaxID=27720 RepID=UPI003461E56F
MDGPRCSGIRKRRKSRSERDQKRRSNGIRDTHVRDSVLRFSSDSEWDNSTNPSSSRPRPPRRKRKDSTSAEEDIIDGFSISGFMTLEALERNMALKPHQCKKNQIEQLEKKRPMCVPNGLNAHIRKSCLHSQQQHSDQENRPCLARAHHKKKHPKKRKRAGTARNHKMTPIIDGPRSGSGRTCSLKEWPC